MLKTNLDVDICGVVIEDIIVVGVVVVASWLVVFEVVVVVEVVLDDTQVVA